MGIGTSDDDRSRRLAYLETFEGFTQVKKYGSIAVFFFFCLQSEMVHSFFLAKWSKAIVRLALPTYKKPSTSDDRGIWICSVCRHCRSNLFNLTSGYMIKNRTYLGSMPYRIALWCSLLSQMVIGWLHYGSRGCKAIPYWHRYPSLVVYHSASSIIVLSKTLLNSIYETLLWIALFSLKHPWRISKFLWSGMYFYVP